MMIQPEAPPRPGPERRPLAGRNAAARPRDDWMRAPSFSLAQVALAALVMASVASVGVARFGREGYTSRRVVAEPSRVAVKRSLPPGVREAEVVKWVPIRRPSGRTELVPWTSVDAETAQDPEALRRMLAAMPLPSIEGPEPSEEDVMEEEKPVPKETRKILLPSVPRPANAKRAPTKTVLDPCPAPRTPSQVAARPLSHLQRPAGRDDPEDLPPRP